MSVSTEASQNVFTGNGVTTVFNTGFYFLLASTVVVKLTPDATGIEEVLVLGIDYTVTMPAGVGLNGSITMLTAPALDDALVIERTVPITQEMSLRQQGSFSPSIHEDGFDRGIFVDQQLDRRITELEGLAGGLVGTLTFGAPVEITDSTTGAGSGLEVARSNHQHAHGVRGGGTLHAVAVSGGAAGFLTGADKALLDALVARTHAFARKLASAQVLTNGAAAAVVTFDDEVLDTGAEYNPANGKFTAGVAGYYKVNATVRADTPALLASGDTLAINLYRNGTLLIEGQSIQSQAAVGIGMSVQLNHTVQLAATDYIEIRCSCGGQNFTINQKSYLTVDRL